MSFNQATLDPWSLEKSVNECKRLGIPYLAPWRHKLGDPDQAASLIRNAGLRVSSLCRGGWFSAPTADRRRERMDDNCRAIDEAATLGSPVLVIVTGPADGQSLDHARALVVESLAELAPYAAKAGVTLGLEPLHPMFAGDRSVVVTMKHANDLVAKIAHPALGVIVDVFHVWWDPDVYLEIERAAGTIAGFHVSDWPVPLPGILMSRDLMGNGVIELKRLREAVEAAGYRGPIEVEIFNEQLWQRADEGALEEICERYDRYVLTPK